MPQVYYIDNPSQTVPIEELKEIGVLHWKLDADDYEQDKELAKLCDERGYNYRDFV